MLNTMKKLLIAFALIVTLPWVTQAFTTGAVGPVSLQNGFPVWWQDDAGVRIQLCLDASPDCLFDPVITGNQLSEQIGFGPEAFWWMSVGDNGAVSLELAMEAAWLNESPVPGDQGPFARIRLNGTVNEAGTWTITGSGLNFTAEATDDGAGIITFKNQGADIFGAVTDDPPFFGVVAPGASQVSAFWGLGGNVVPEAITITGPGTTQTILPAEFALQAGRLFNDGDNIAPIANLDLKAAAVGTTTSFSVTANDVDTIAVDNVHGINPRAVGLGAAAPFVFEPGDPANIATPGIITTGGGRVAKLADGRVSYRPAPTFSGVDSFAYVIQDTGGCISGQATTIDPITGNNICLPSTVAVPNPAVSASVIITVEQQTNEASFRPKLQKWDIGGTTSVVNLSTTDAATNPVLFTNLMGAQEVPARITTGQGDVSLTLRNDTLLGQVIDFTLNYSGLTGVTQAHIHNGAVGSNGPPHIFLCSNQPNPPAGTPICPASGGTVTGTRTAADLQAAGSVTTFAELIAAIQAGGTYVNVHTAAVTSGEIRGQVGRNVVAVHSGPSTAAPILGVVAVPPIPGGQQVSTWALPQKLQGVPSADRTITIQTSAGNTTTVPLKIR